MHYISKHFSVEDCNQLILEPEDWSETEWAVFMKVFGFKEAERIVLSEYKLEAYGEEM